MPVYTYKARDPAGKSIKGVMEAATQDELTDKLRKMGYMTTRADETISTIGLGSLSIFQRITTEDMALFNVQLSNLINSGIPILKSLEILYKQTDNKRLKETLGNALRNVEAGDHFSQALAKHPAIFSSLFISMVRAGEASGKLDVILIRFAEFSERQADLRQKIKGVLFYPTILLIASLAVMLFIVTFIIPQFVEIFLKSDVRLPLVTLILFNVGMALKHFWILFLLAFAALAAGFRYFIHRESGRIWWDGLKLRLPLIGHLYRKAALSRFARTLSTLVTSGVPILESLGIVKNVMENEVLARVIKNARGSVEKGESLSESLKISGEFPDDIVQMVSVGEETGGLDVMLNKISDFYEMSLGYAIKKITALLEPVFLAVMGCLVGIIMMSMLMPIYDMVKILRH